MKINWQEVFDAAREPLREIVLAIIPFALERLAVIPDAWAVVLYLVLRGIDKYMHNQAPKGVVGGLTRFV